MSLLDDVSIVVTPNGYKAGELYAVVPVPTEGAEEITTPDFSSSTGWSFTNSGGSNGWIIDAGRAICDASATTPYRNLNSTFSLVNGKSYRLIIDILQSAENMKIVVGSTTLSETLPTGTNLNYEYFIPQSVHSGGAFTIYAGSSDLQEIDNVSVKEYTAADMDVTRATAATRVDEDGLVNYAEIIGDEEITNGDFSQEGAEKTTNGDFSVDSNWNQVGSNGWSIDTATSTLNFTNASSYVYQGISTVSGKSYKVTLDIELDSGTIVAKSFSAQDILTVTSTGRQTLTGYFKEGDSNANFGFVASGSASGKIHSISVKEVGADWTLSGAWSLGTNKVIFSDTSNGDIRTSTAIFTATKTYQIKLTVADLTGSNTAFFGIGDGSASNLVGYDNYANGDYTFNVIAPNGSGFRIYSTTSSGSSYSITNISIKEVTRDNVPRIDYTGGGCPHVLAEPQRTNLVTDSEDFTDSSWSKSSSITLTPNDSISPNGLTNSSKLNFTSVSTTNSLSFNFLTIVDDYSCSIFVKYIDTQFIQLWFGSTGFSGGNVNFDLINGTKNELSGATGSIKDFGNGWYKITMTKSSTGGSTSALAIVTVSSLSSGRFGDEVDGSVHIWGAQLEEGSYATSYIPTSGSTVTRNQDIFTRDGIGSLINSTEGTLVIEPRYFINDGSTRKISISDGTGTNRIYITPYQGLASRIRYIFTNGGATQADLQVTGIDITVSRKLAFVWATNRFELWQNGIKISEDTSGTTPSAGTFNQIHFGSETGSGTALFEGELKQLQVYKTALTDTQLAALTS